MIQNRIIGRFYCIDQKIDTLELIESVCFNTVILDLRAVNDSAITHIILDEETALTLSNCLKKWSLRGEQ